jgi:hypothetical protein
MDSNQLVVYQRTDKDPLGFTYPCYKDMYDNNIVFVYRGVVTSDLVTHVLEIMEDRLEVEVQRQDKRLSKKLYNIMVECLTNVYSSEDKSGLRDFDPEAVLLVKKMTKSYCVVTGSYILSSQVSDLKRMLDRINNMNSEALRNYYQEVLGTEDARMQGLTNLGIIDLARKSKHSLEYEFKYLNEDYTFFSLEARISASSI